MCVKKCTNSVAEAFRKEAMPFFPFLSTSSVWNVGSARIGKIKSMCAFVL